MTQVFNVSFATTDPPKVSKDLFAYDFPKGAQFYDTDLGVWVRDADIAESHLKNVVKELRNDRMPRYVWYIALVTFIFFAACYWKWRSRTKK